MKACVLGMGIVAPGAAGCEAFSQSLSQPAPAEKAVKVFGDESDLRARRLPRLDRMTLSAAKEAVGSSSREGLAVVFGTAYGGLASTADFLDGLATRGSAFGSPTAFHQSVHHAPLGQLSISLGITGACLTTSAREISGESALKLGMDLLASGRSSRVLVIAADELTPALVSAYQAFGVTGAGEGAAALLLGKEGASDLWIDSVALKSHPTSSLRFAASEVLSSLVTEAQRFAGPTPELSAFEFPGAPEESSVLKRAFPSARWVRDFERFGFNPSGGLLRVVASALRLRAGQTSGATALIHGLAAGGGQAVVTVRYERP